MTESRVQKITSATRQKNASQYSLEKPPKADHICLNQSQTGMQYGRWKIISPERRYTRNWSGAYVPVRCQCGNEQWIPLTSLTRGLSKGCPTCATNDRKYVGPTWLYKRMTAAKQRCTNPQDENYERYGARGIKFEFNSVMEACYYVMGIYPNIEESRELELDRIDNNKNYERGNLRLVTRKENVANRELTVLSEYDPQYWPYAETVVRRLLAAGLTREHIIARAELAVKEKRKNWRGIKARLESMTYSMPESIIVTPYRKKE